MEVDVATGEVKCTAYNGPNSPDGKSLLNYRIIVVVVIMKSLSVSSSIP